jgi:hypothetical protein
MRFRSGRLRFRRRYLVIPILLIVVSLVFAVRFNTMTQSTSPRVSRESPPPSPYCRSGDPLAGVYNPLRFRVLSKCQVASGVVESVTLHDQGTWRIYISLDAKYASLIDGSSSSYKNSFLVLELISQDQAIVHVPSVGQHITFVGPWVFDTENLWNAICPVWSIQAD